MTLAVCLGGLIIIPLAAIRIYGFWTLPGLALSLFSGGFALRAVILLAEGQRYVFRWISLSQDELLILAALSLLGCLSLLLGITLGARFRSSRTSRLRGEREIVAYSPNRLVIAFWVLTGVQAILIERALGGPTAAVLALSRRSFEGTASGLATNISYCSIPVLLLALTEARKHRLPSPLIISSSSLVAAFPWFFLVNGRGMVAVACWSSVFLLSKVTNRKPRTTSSLLLGSVMTITVTAGLAWRSSAQTGLSFSSSAAPMLGQAWRLVSDALPLLDHFRVGVAYSAMHGHDNGRLLADAFSVLVPRDLWPGKPLFMPQILGQSVLYSNLSGLPAGLLGEGYISFGVAGVVLFAFAFGVLVGILHGWLSTISAISPATSWLVVASVGTVIGSLRTGAQGGLMALQIATVFLPIVLLTCGMAKRRRSGNYGSNVSACSLEEADTTVALARRDHGVPSGWKEDASLS